MYRLSFKFHHYWCSLHIAYECMMMNLKLAIFFRRFVTISLIFTLRLYLIFDEKDCKEWKKGPKQFLSCDWFVVSLMLYGSSNPNCIYSFCWRWSVCPDCCYYYIAIIFTFKNNLLFLCIPWDNVMHFSLCSKYTCPKWFVWKSTNPLIIFFPHFSRSYFFF